MSQFIKYSRFHVTVIIALSAIIITGCNSDEQVMERPEKVYYDTAQRRMKANNFFSAIESLQAIEARYPFGQYAEQAQSELIYAYYMNGEDEAAHELLHPRHSCSKHKLALTELVLHIGQMDILLQWLARTR